MPKSVKRALEAALVAALSALVSHLFAAPDPAVLAAALGGVGRLALRVA